MTLPSRMIRPPADPQAAAARLIVFARHGLPELADTLADDMWRRGRSYVFGVLSALATPIALYYHQIGYHPLSAMDFPVGSAERFAYGSVGAAMDGSPAWKSMIVGEFRKSCAEEVSRAVRLMAGSASQCMYLMEEIASFDAAISAL